MVQAAKRGDTVVTTGGLIGKITKSTDDSEVELEIAPNVRVRLARSGIADVRAKGEPVKDPARIARGEGCVVQQGVRQERRRQFLRRRRVASSDPPARRS